MRIDEYVGHVRLPDPACSIPLSDILTGSHFGDEAEDDLGQFRPFVFLQEVARAGDRHVCLIARTGDQ